MSPSPDPRLFSFYLTALGELSRALSVAGRDRRKKTSPAGDGVRHILGTFAVSRGLLLQFDPDEKKMILVESVNARVGASSRPFAPTRRELALLSRCCRPFHPEMPPGGLEDCAEAFRPWLGRHARQPFVLAVPLATGTSFEGLILLGPRVSGEPLTGLDLEVLEQMGAMLAHQFEDQRTHARLARQVQELKHQGKQLKQVYLETVRALAGVIDGPDSNGRPGHSARVAALSYEMARRLGFAQAACERLYLAGLLHDIGKEIISREVLEKRDPLAPHDRLALERHPQASCDLISHLRFPWGDIAEIIRHHHERLDGRGYPDRLPGEQISLEAKILMMAEAFDAMASDQPWRPRLDPAAIGAQISDNVGVQFEPAVVEALCAAVADGLDGNALQDDFVPHLAASFDLSLIRAMLAELRHQLRTPTIRPAARVIDAIQFPTAANQ